jgi:hypothetical protein
MCKAITTKGSEHSNGQSHIFFFFSLIFPYRMKRQTYDMRTETYTTWDIKTKHTPPSFSPIIHVSSFFPQLLLFVMA